MENNIELSIYGTRGSCATGSKEYAVFGGDTSSYALRIGDSLHFLDAGSGIRRAMLQELTPAIKEAYLHITHGHADHIDMGCASGLYFNKIKDGIKVVGYKDVSRALKNFFSGDTLWPVPVKDMKGLNPDITQLQGGETLEYPAYKVKTLQNYHPLKHDDVNSGFGGSIGFKFEIPDGEKLVRIAYVTDMEFDYLPGCKVQPQAARLKKEFVNFVQDADVLLADTHFINDEYERTMPFVRGWGHSTLERIIDLANEAGVKKLLGTHHAPARTDEILKRLEGYAVDYAKSTGFRGEFQFARDGDRYDFGGGK